MNKFIQSKPINTISLGNEDFLSILSQLSNDHEGVSLIGLFQMKMLFKTLKIETEISDVNTKLEFHDDSIATRTLKNSSKLLK